MRVLLPVLYLICQVSAGYVKEFFFVNNHEKFSDAKSKCEDKYHDFAIVNSENDHQKILQVAKPYTDCVWIGLKEHGGNWEWETNRDGDVNFDKWAPNPGSGRCVCLKEGLWYQRDCDDELRFFCDDSVIELVLVKENKTWEEALDYCKTHDSFLARVTTDKERIVADRRESDTPRVWTGLRFLNGDWFWVKDHWESTPDSLPSCPAVALRCGTRNQQAKEWENRDCGEKLNFLCRKYPW